jgi:hypothetical protein
MEGGRQHAIYQLSPPRREGCPGVRGVDRCGAGNQLVIALPPGRQTGCRPGSLGITGDSRAEVDEVQRAATKVSARRGALGAAERGGVQHICAAGTSPGQYLPEGMCTWRVEGGTAPEQRDFAPSVWFTSHMAMPLCSPGPGVVVSGTAPRLSSGRPSRYRAASYFWSSAWGHWRRPGDESIQRPAGSPLFLEAKANRCPNHRRASESDAADADPALRPPRPGDYPHASSPHPTLLPFHARRPGQASHALPPPPILSSATPTLVPGQFSFSLNFLPPQTSIPDSPTACATRAILLLSSHPIFSSSPLLLLLSSAFSPSTSTAPLRPVVGSSSPRAPFFAPSPSFFPLLPRRAFRWVRLRLFHISLFLAPLSLSLLL